MHVLPLLTLALLNFHYTYIALYCTLSKNLIMCMSNYPFCNHSNLSMNLIMPMLHFNFSCTNCTFYVWISLCMSLCHLLMWYWMHSNIFILMWNCIFYPWILCNHEPYYIHVILFTLYHCISGTYYVISPVLLVFLCVNFMFHVTSSFTNVTLYEL